MDWKMKDLDLVLSESTFDLEDEYAEELSTNQEIMEHFDMQIGDDIDFPEIFSKQRENVNSDDLASDMKRVEDAKRILKEYPVKDVKVEIVKGKLVASWRVIV